MLTSKMCLQIYLQEEVKHVILLDWIPSLNTAVMSNPPTTTKMSKAKEQLE